MSGWICLHRGWRDCDAFDDGEPMSEREAWIWLIETAAWKDMRRRNARGEGIVVARGQLHSSLRSLGQSFGWGKNRVARYLEKLARHDMIGTVSGQAGILITIRNYGHYQDVSPPAEPETGTGAGQARDTQEHGKHASGSDEPEAVRPHAPPAPHPPPPAPADTAKAVFDQGVALLMAAGLGERAARSMLGRWRKDHGDGAILEALGEARARAVSDPVPWMQRWLKSRARAPAATRQLDILLSQTDRYRRREAA